jgi:hypothetical protein
MVMLFPVLMLRLESKASKIVAENRDEEKNEEDKTFIGKIWAHYQYGLKKSIPAKLFHTIMQFKFFWYSIIFILIDGKNAQISLFIILTFTYCCYYVIVRPFNYFIQNVVAIVNECLVLLIAFLFLGFLENGNPDYDLAYTIIVLFSMDIIACFILGLGFQFYMIKMKLQNTKEGTVDSLPKSVKPPIEYPQESYPDVLDTVRNLSEKESKNNDRIDNEEGFASKESLRGELRKNNPSVIKNIAFNVDKIMNQDDVESNSKNSNMDLLPDAQFLQNAIENTVENSRVNEDEHIDVFGGNL